MPPGWVCPAERRSSAGGCRYRRESHGGVVGQQELGDRLLRPVARQRREALVVADHVGERRAEHADRGAKNDPGTVVVTHPADAVEQRPRSIQVDAVPLLEVGLRSARDDGGEVEDDVGAARNQIAGDPLTCEIARRRCRYRSSRPLAASAPRCRRVTRARPFACENAVAAASRSASWRRPCQHRRPPESA